MSLLPHKKLGNQRESLQNTGGDLSSLTEEMRKERNSRTMTLRRPNRITIGISHLNSGSKLYDDDKSKCFSHITVEYITSVLESGNNQALISFIDEFSKMVFSKIPIARNLVKSPGLTYPFISALQGSYSADGIRCIISAISLIFPNCGPNRESFIDDGLCLVLPDHLLSSNPDLISSSIMLISVISESSGYARDSVLSFGLHDYLIEIALSGCSTQIIDLACYALEKVFSNQEPIEPKTLCSCFDQILKLLRISSETGLQHVIGCLVSITDKMPSLVYDFFDQNQHIFLVSLLDEPEMISVSLRLIGNMSVGDAIHVRRLVGEANLFERLQTLLWTDFTADVFWVISNLIETLPYFMLDLLNIEFINRVVEVTTEGGFDLKKEGTFLLATIILFTDTDKLNMFVSPEIESIFSDMLHCGIGLIVLRCLDALLCLFHAIKRGTSIDNIMCDDLRNGLERLLNSSIDLIKEKAEYLIEQMDIEEQSILLS